MLSQLLLFSHVLLGTLQYIEGGPALTSIEVTSMLSFPKGYGEILSNFLPGSVRAEGFSSKWSICPIGTKARGFSIKLKKWTASKPGAVNTIGTGLALLCTYPRTDSPVVRITSQVASEGTWTKDIFCCDSKAFLAKHRRLISYGPDFMSVDNVDFQCYSPAPKSFTNAYEYLLGNGPREIELSKRSIGSWSKEECRYGICGINTRIDPPISLNGFRFLCCPNEN